MTDLDAWDLAGAHHLVKECFTYRAPENFLGLIYRK